MTDQLKEESKVVWDQVAPGWEQYRDYMWRQTRHVAEWLVDQTTAEGAVVLDLAAGPGEIGFLAAERVGPGGRVVVTDFAPAMVDVAHRRAQELGLGNIETRVLDAEDMDLPDDTFDGIICRWGFMLMQDPARALKECRRVLKEGGTLALSVWGGPDANPWLTIPGATMTQIGYPSKSDPYGPGGMFSMAEPDQVEEMLLEAGFTSAQAAEVPVSWNYASFDEGWEFMIRVAGRIAPLVKELPVDKVAELRRTLEENYRDYISDEGMSIPAVTINAVAS